MSNHTPAPWTLKPQAKNHQTLSGATAGLIADIHKDEDALLIAAAPELFAIAEQALAAFNYLSIKATSAADREEFKRRETAARTAIYKATGVRA